MKSPSTGFSSQVGAGVFTVAMLSGISAAKMKSVSTAGHVRTRSTGDVATLRRRHLDLAQAHRAPPLDLPPGDGPPRRRAHRSRCASHNATSPLPVIPTTAPCYCWVYNGGRRTAVRRRAAMSGDNQGLGDTDPMRRRTTPPPAHHAERRRTRSRCRTMTATPHRCRPSTCNARCPPRFRGHRARGPTPGSSR